MKKKLTNLFLVAAFLVFGFGSASAFPLYNGTALFPGTQFEDDNLDYLINLDNDPTTIGVGDVLVSAIEFTKILDLNGGAPEYNTNRPADELVALSMIQVTSINGNQWTFGEYLNTPMVQVYTGGNINLLLGVANQDPTMAQAIAAIQDGTHLWDFSITANDPDTFWSFTDLVGGANSIATMLLTGSSTKVGVANYQLNQVWGDDIFSPIVGIALPGGDGLADMVGSGDILGGRGLINGAFARSDVDVNVNPIPEPATMTLFGIGLLSLAAVAKRRKE